VLSTSGLLLAVTGLCFSLAAFASTRRRSDGTTQSGTCGVLDNLRDAVTHLLVQVHADVVGGLSRRGRSVLVLGCTGDEENPLATLEIPAWRHEDYDAGRILAGYEQRCSGVERPAARPQRSQL
jgi:hypothetical protein